MPVERVVMVATSYPRFPGDTVGTFMEPIAHGLADRGHEVHVVLPWHPRWRRADQEGNVHFHLFRYAPLAALNVFGYASALEADVRLRSAALAAAPLAAGAAWREARTVAARVRATMMHGHWIVPGGVIAAVAAAKLPLVISLHGSDVYVAERHRVIGLAARWAFRRADFVTACSDDLRARGIALGAAPARSATVPYGVDAHRFRPDSVARDRMRGEWSLPPGAEVVFAAGRFVRKKGFEHLIDAVASLAPSRPGLHLVLAGGGDLERELRERISAAGLGTRVVLPGVLPQGAVAAALAASDVSVVPSVRDSAGNVDGLPNVVLETLASGTPLVATSAGGIGTVVRNGETGVLVPERDPGVLAAVLARLLDNPDERARLGATARAWTLRHAGWADVARAFERAYAEARACRARQPHAGPLEP